MKSDNKMNATLSLGNQPSRRDFLKISGVMGGGLVLAATAPGWAQGTPNLVGGGELNAYVQIKPDGSMSYTVVHLRWVRALQRRYR